MPLAKWKNFTDFGHFPFVHPGLLGDPARPVVPAHTARIEGMVVHYEIVRPEVPQQRRLPRLFESGGAAPRAPQPVRTALPYTIVLRLG